MTFRLHMPREECYAAYFYVIDFDTFARAGCRYSIAYDNN